MLLLNDDISYQDRATETRKLATKGADADTLGRLFFAARNGAISHLLLCLERHFASHGLTVRAAWKETSFGGPTVNLTLIDKRTGEHVRALGCDRKEVHPGSNTTISTMVYRLTDVQVGEYYRSRKPRIAEEFDEILGSEAFQKMVGEWINGVNYPFTYEAHSSF